MRDSEGPSICSVARPDEELLGSGVSLIKPKPGPLLLTPGVCGGGSDNTATSIQSSTSPTC